MVMNMFKKKDPDQKIIEDGISKDDPIGDDPIIELTDEITVNPEEDRKPVSPDNDDFILPEVDKAPPFEDDEGMIVFEENANSSMLEYESDGDEIDFFTDDLEPAADDDIIAMPSEASPTFGEDDNGIDMLADIEFEREEGEGIIPMAELDNDDVETDDDIIEITEFDQHFSEDDDETLAHAGLLDPSGLKDEDFLELFDIEEEGPMEDEEMRKLSESEEKTVEDELSRFFDDALEDEPGIGNNASQPVEKLSEPGINLDLAMAAATLTAGTGKFNRPETPFPPDPARTKEGHNQKDSPEFNAADLTAVSPEAIDRSIERIINEKLAGRIEHIIYEIIEKSVKREINRLKESLLENTPPKDNF